MKKIICLVLCVLTAFALLPAQADTLFVNSFGYSFAISYPEDGYYDDTSDAGYNQEGEYWTAGSIFADADDGLNWDFYIYREDEYDSFDLAWYSPESEEFTKYCAAFESWFASKELEVIGYCESTRDDVVFAVGSGINPDRGPVVIADTMMNGWEVNIVFYAFADGTFTNYRDLTDGDYTLIGEILESFVRK